MEKLTEEQRLKVSRMSDERLRGKLINAGYKEHDIARLDRPRLLVRYAQVLLAETAYVAGDDLNKVVEVGVSWGYGRLDGGSRHLLHQRSAE